MPCRGNTTRVSSKLRDIAGADERTSASHTALHTEYLPPSDHLPIRASAPEPEFQTRPTTPSMLTLDMHPLPRPSHINTACSKCRRQRNAHQHRDPSFLRPVLHQSSPSRRTTDRDKGLWNGCLQWRAIGGNMRMVLGGARLETRFEGWFCLSVWLGSMMRCDAPAPATVG